MSKREEKPLENKCWPIFFCTDRDCSAFEDSVHYPGHCHFGAFDKCNSAVARTNAMVLELQRMGFTVELKKKEGKA
jgi:hypothetical protein